MSIAFTAPTALCALRGAKAASSCSTRSLGAFRPVQYSRRERRSTIQASSSSSTTSNTPQDNGDSASAAGAKNTKQSGTRDGARTGGGLLWRLVLRVRSLMRRISLVGCLFLAVTYAWSLILFIPMVIAHPFVLMFDGGRRRFHDYIAMAWMQLSMGSAFIRYKVTNAHLLPPPNTPVVYVANHASYIDIYSFAYLHRRIKYVSKAEIFRMPVVGWAMAMAGNVPLHRASRRGQMEAYRKMVGVLRSGLSLVVFPEGTRSATGRLRRFHAGAFRAAKSANVPVIPITIDGTRQMMPADALVPLQYPWNGIELVVHPAIESTDKTVEELSDMAFRSIDSALEPHLQTHSH